MRTPYEVLGVSPNASDDEIKKAYKALVKKYHPDKYRDSDLADLANEKMKEINAAYDEIQKMRASGGASRGGGYSGNPNAGGTAGFQQIRQMIVNNRLAEAEQALRSMDLSMQNAEWNYLMGCIMYKRGYFTDAQSYLNRACGMDPHNREYAQARDQLYAQTSHYGSGYRTSTEADTACNCCSNLICADCCCEMMGGDLIRCC